MEVLTEPGVPDPNEAGQHRVSSGADIHDNFSANSLIDRLAIRSIPVLIKSHRIVEQIIVDAIFA